MSEFKEAAAILTKKCCAGITYWVVATEYQSFFFTETQMTVANDRSLKHLGVADFSPAEDEPPKAVIVGSGISDKTMTMAREVAKHKGVALIVDDEAVRREEAKRAVKSKLTAASMLAVPWLSPAASMIDHALDMIPKGRTQHRYGLSFRDRVNQATTHDAVSEIVREAHAAGVTGDTLRKLEAAAGIKHQDLNDNATLYQGN